MNRSTSPTEICALCGGSAREVRPGPPFDIFPGVTSDCKAWPRLGSILCCESCGHVQKRLDDIWRVDVEKIYSEYVMYHLSNGFEQVTFDAGLALPRTVKLIQGMLGEGGATLPDTGSLLDVGCGGGAFLAAFHKVRPGWALTGQDLCSQRGEEVLALPGVCSFHCGGLDKLSGSYDAVSMIYVLEHMPAPVDQLARVRGLLKPNGTLLIMVPDLAQSFFDFTVVDHCGHFYLETLIRAVQQAGFEVLAQGQHWMVKEVGIIARPQATRMPVSSAGDVAHHGLTLAENGMDWLAAALKQAQRFARECNTHGRGFGLFGTAIAGTWLVQALDEKVDFFVDEDRRRWGKKHLGLPIIGPAQVPDGAGLFLGFPTQIARGISQRLSVMYPGLLHLYPEE